jgi:hypothetical protein
MDKSLIDYLKQIPDCREPHGLRHPLWLVLLIIIGEKITMIKAEEIMTTVAKTDDFS